MNRFETERQLQSVLWARADVLMFLLAFSVGIAGYGIAHTLGVRQWLQTSIVVGVMIAYAVAVWLAPRVKLRLDQAGDNAYYLGLLFTLVSMAVALYEFGAVHIATGRSGTDQIIMNFGIALASTIAGIFLRVLLHQMRVDPADLENVSRIELSDASRRVKASLDIVSNDMTLFHDQMAQKMSDVVGKASEDVSKVLSAFANDVGDATGRMLSRAEQAQQEMTVKTREVVEKLELAAVGAEAAIGRLAKVEPPPTKLAFRLEKVTASLEGLEKPINQLTAAFAETSAAHSDIAEKLGAATREVIQISRIGTEHQAKTAEELKQAAHSFKASMSAATEVLQQDKALILELGKASSQLAQEVKRTQEASGAVIHSFTKATQELSSAIRKSELVG